MAIEYVEITDANQAAVKVAVDTDGDNSYQIVKNAFGGDGTFTLVTSSVGMPVSIIQPASPAAATAYLNVRLTDGSAFYSASGGGGGGDASEATLSELNDKVVAVDTDNVTIVGSVAVTGDFYPATQAISAASLPLPTGASTAANQATLIGHVDGIEALLTTLAGAVAGTEVQVDILTMPTVTIGDGGGSITVDAPVATPVFVRLSDGSAAITTLPVSLASVPSHAVTNAGTFAVQAAQSGTWTVQPGNTANTTPWLASIHDGTTKATVRDLASNDALNVAIVDGSGNQVTSFGGGTQYTEDVASAGGESLTLVGAVRQDSPVSSTSADGDYANLKVDSVGRLWCNVNINGGSLTSITSISSVSSCTVSGVNGHDVPVTGVPVLGAGYASAAAPTDVSADGDAVRAWHLRNGAAACVLTAAGALIGGDAANGLDVDVTRLPALAAGTNLIGKTAAGRDVSNAYDGTTALVPKFAVISTSSSGDNPIVAAVVGKKIRVLRWTVSANGTVAIKWRRASTDITGLHYMAQYKTDGGSDSQFGHFETGVNEALNLNLSGAVAVGGELTYVEV